MDDLDIFSWLEEIKQYFKEQSNQTKIVEKSKPTNTEPISTHSTEPFSVKWQAPIRGDYKNLGDYSPDKPTDARHKDGHKGVDLRAPGGTPLYPIGPGVVTNVGNSPVGGNVVNMDHPDGVRSYYAHLATVEVAVGDKVDYDTVIGTVGDSGNAKGTFPHLHIQIWRNGVLQNPGKFFHVPKYTNVTKDEKRWISEDFKQQAANFIAGKKTKKTAQKAQLNKLISKIEIYEQLTKF